MTTNLFDKMNLSNDEYLSTCGIHEPKHQGKTYEYLQTPVLIKTSNLILCCCLNIGIDPPGYKKPKNTSTIYSWINVKEHRKREIGYDITLQLASQYQRYAIPSITIDPLWDPSTEKVKRTCLVSREKHGKERILFHYNGHGVPFPTINHECWFFDEEITTYVPMNIAEIFNRLGEKAIYVFDCPHSERLFKWFLKKNDVLQKQFKRNAEFIVFSGYNELESPQTNPNYPVDLFTACMTTPLSMALLDYYYSTEKIIELPLSFLKTLPIDQKTKVPVFSELYAIFTSIVEAIAWDVLPNDLFMKLFRQDVCVASLFKHFILANRIMKKFHYKPQSFPQLPDTSNHSLWKDWDAALEMSIPKLMAFNKQINHLPSPFYNNLTVSFKSYISIHPKTSQIPCPLPMIFRLALRKDYTCEVFSLVAEYIDLGFFACDKVVNIGFIPLLVQSLEKETLQTYGLFCLTKIFSYDSTSISSYLRNSINTLMRIIQQNRATVVNYMNYINTQQRNNRNSLRNTSSLSSPSTQTSSNVSRSIKHLNMNSLQQNNLNNNNNTNNTNSFNTYQQKHHHSQQYQQPFNTLMNTNVDNNYNQIICALFLLAQLFCDDNIINQIDVRSVYQTIISLTTMNNAYVKVWSMVCLGRLMNSEVNKELICKNQQFFPMLKELITDECPLVRSSIIYLMMKTITSTTNECSRQLLTDLQSRLLDFAQDGCPTVRSLLVVLLFRMISNGFAISKFENIIEYLSNDTDPDVIRASERLLSVKDTLKSTSIINKKQMNSPLEQFIKSSKKIFDDLNERFYGSIRDIFRKPLLTKVIDEKKKATNEWAEKQMEQIQRSIEPKSSLFETHQMKEISKLNLNVINNNLYVPQKMIFHPFLPVLLSDVSDSSIGYYEYSISPNISSTFQNCNTLNTQITYMEWMNKQDSYLITGCNDTSIRIWGNWSDKPKCLSSFKGIPNYSLFNPNIINTLNTCFTTMMNNKVCIALNKEIYVWDIQCENNSDLFNFTTNINCLNSFSDKTFLSGSLNGIVSTVDIRSKNITNWINTNGEITSLGYCARSFTVITSSNKGNGLTDINFYDIRKFGENNTTQAFKSFTLSDYTCCCVHEELPYYCIGTQNNNCSIYNILSGSCIHQLKSHEKL